MRYKIQSELHSPDGYLFDRMAVDSIIENIQLISPDEHGKSIHIVAMNIEAKNIDEAWRVFYKAVAEFVEAIAFHTSSYLAFFDRNHLITNLDQRISLLAKFERTNGTALTVYFQEDAEDIHTIIENSRKDIRFKNFLHCYRMATIVYAPETLDAYEKYLLLACEALAGGVENGDGYVKVDRDRLKQIMGLTLHKHFFSHVDPISGKTIRNSNMHLGRSTNPRPQELEKLVLKIRDFVKSEYDLRSLPSIDVDKDPIRGFHRDDGKVLILEGSGVESIELSDVKTVRDYMLATMGKFTLLGGDEANSALLKM